MSTNKGLKFISIIPYIIISVILVEIAYVMYDVMLKDKILNPNKKVSEDSVMFILSDTVGTTTVNGKDIIVEISGKNYGDLTCNSNDEKIAKCKIENGKLIVTPQKNAGLVNVEVIESKENKKVELQFTIEENNNFANNTETVKPVTTPTPVVNTKPVTNNTVVTSTLRLSGYIGTGYVNGNDVVIEVYGSNYGQLSCSSNDTNIATCKMTGNVLVVTPKNIVGTAYITIKENRFNKTEVFQINVKKEYQCSEGTLVNDSSRGYICVTDGNEDYEEVCNRYHTTQTESDPLCVDEDITGVYNNETLIIGCTKEKHTDETYHCNNQHICIITEIKKTCVDFDYRSTYACPVGFSRYSGNNETLKCYKSATLKK